MTFIGELIMDLKKEQFLDTLELIGKRPDFFSAFFYERVAERMPEFKEIFRNTDLRLQRAEFIKGLLVIFSLYEDASELSTFLTELGTRHVCYEVRSEHYPQVKEALMDSLRELHGSTWNSKLEHNWEELMNYITQLMLQGSQRVQVSA